MYDSLVNERLFLYKPMELVVTTVPDTVPWPLKWLLAFHNRRHIFSSKKMDLQSFSHELCNFSNKVKWRQHFALTREDGARHKKLVNWNRNVPYCPHKHDPHTCNWLDLFRRKSLYAARNFSSTNLGNNMFPLLRIALKQLRSLDGYYICPNDKAHGFTFIAFADMLILTAKVIVEPTYRHVFSSSINEANLKRDYRKLANRVEKHLDLPGTARAICDSLHGMFYTHMDFTIKTHKLSGDVKPRPLHKVGRFAFEGLGRWLSSLLAPKVQQLPHFCRDSLSVAGKLRNLVVPRSAKFIHVDLKNFFLSGFPEVLAKDVASYFNGPLRSLVYDIVFFLCDNQWVYCWYTGAMAKCLNGAGMGLHFAGHVANLSFAKAVEEEVLTWSQLNAHSVYLYTRYFDDCLFIAGNRTDCSLSAATPLIQRLKDHSAHFTVGDIIVNSQAIKFLDLSLAFHGNRIVVSAALDKIPIPLDTTSLHPESVHSSWPSSLVRRIWDISGRDDKQVDSLIGIYEMANASHSTLSRMRSFHKCIKSGHKKVKPQNSILWFKAAFHPVKQRALRTSSRILPPPAGTPQIRYAWNSGSYNLISITNLHNKAAAKRCRE